MTASCLESAAREDHSLLRSDCGTIAIGTHTGDDELDRRMHIICERTICKAFQTYGNEG